MTSILLLVYFIFSFNLVFLVYFIVLFLLLFTFTFHLKLQIFLKINHRCLKEVIAQLQNDLYYNELVI